MKLTDDSISESAKPIKFPLIPCSQGIRGQRVGRGWALIDRDRLQGGQKRVAQSGHVDPDYHAPTLSDLAALLLILRRMRPLQAS